MSTNRIIAKNSIVLFVRMLLTMGISLYTSRLVLSVLGVDDYGIYNIVGGAVAMLSFLNSSLATSTQRFLNYAMGVGDDKQLSKTFSTAFFAHVFIAILFLIIAETLGLWFMTSILNLPEGSYNDSLNVYHAVVCSLFISIIGTPFQAAIIAHERMSYFAFVSILEVCIKLLLVGLLFCINSNKLIYYGWFMFLSTVVTTCIYVILSITKFNECRLKFEFDKAILKQMLSFSSWMISGCVTNMLSTQGINILINVYFGVAFNAARGIAIQVQGALVSFVNSFLTAVKPQIVKSYSKGDVDRVNNLVFASTKLSFFLLWMIVCPIIINAEYILSLWLTIVPDYAVLFTQLVLIDLLVTILYTPIATISQATGKIRNYQLIISLSFILIFLLTWLLFDLHFPVYYTFIISIIINIIGLILRLIEMKYSCGFPFAAYIKEVLKPICTIVILSLVILYILIKINIINQTFIDILINSLLLEIYFFVIIWIFGLNNDEKASFKSHLRINKTHSL